MQIKLDDDLAARYQAIAEDCKQPLSVVIERQLARFVDYPPTVRALVVGREPLQQIEALLGGGQILSPQILVDRVRSYASVTLGKVVLDLSHAQKSEITHRAQKRGISPDVVVKEIIDLLLDQMFDAVTPYR
jgi:hypothetical protein